MLTTMILLMPWLKYFMNCNPWIYDLDERFVQQISTSMQDMASEEYGGIPNVADTARKIISRSRQQAEVRKELDLWSFAPHYPYPPPGRRYAMGMQAGGAAGSLIKFTLLVFTTHALNHGCDDPNCQGRPHASCKKGRSTEQFVLSNSVVEPVYRVMLWYNNPYHFLTGYVEASISNGRPSQPNKYLGGEHPMWLVTGHSPNTAARDSMTGVGMIDAFFDNWLPTFVHECRVQGMQNYLLASGKEHAEAAREAKKYADSKYEEVLSQDGFSPVIPKQGLEAWSRESKASNASQYVASQKYAQSGPLSAMVNLNQQIIGHDQKYDQAHEADAVDAFEASQKRIQYLEKQLADAQARNKLLEEQNNKLTQGQSEHTEGT